MQTRDIAGTHARLLSWPEVQEFAARPDLFSRVAAHADETASVPLGDPTSAPTAVSVIYTTPNYVSLLDVHPVLGTVPAAEPV